ncbi:MAG: efflux RND transporter periplasmic adaptor subunit [Bryobacteraceae bacterium]|nr:efflux RND transporter periplasmic adaptor subunit [Bryobacteraceae bacterium]
MRNRHAAVALVEEPPRLPREVGGAEVEEFPWQPDPAPRRGRAFKYLLLPALAAVALIVWKLLAVPAAPTYSYAPVERGDIVKAISATGALQALVTVQVGSQTSGRLEEIYIDFNSRVRKGDIVARLDQSQAQAQLAQVGANLVGAQAGVQAAQSAVANAQASLVASEANRDRIKAAQMDAERAYKRTIELGEAGVIPKREVEVAEATLAQANAQLAQADAQVQQATAQVTSAGSQLNQAQAQVRQAQASVEMARVNLDHTIIRAPIDGVVIARNVDVGQTVAASLQAPILFLIANDLTRMQVLADIDEADVGQLHPDNRVIFTVDAYPGETFRGTIAQIRLNPQTVQNVVTYTAVIDVGNPDLKLKPGMTANVTVAAAERRDVLKTPNAALRFRPEGAENAPPARQRAGTQVVWMSDGKGTLKPVEVTLGITDGIYSELLSGDLRENDRVVIASNAAGRSASRPSSGAANPMMPFGGRGGRR